MSTFYEPSSKKIRFNFGEKPTTNIDGTPLNDFRDYLVYYVKYASLVTQQEKAIEHSKIINNKLKEAKLLTKTNYEQISQPFFVDLTATNPENGNVYFFIIAASDADNNPKEDKFKPKELGIDILRLEVS